MYYRSIFDFGFEVTEMICLWFPRAQENSCDGVPTGGGIDWTGYFDELQQQPLWSFGSGLPADVAVVGFLCDGDVAWQRPLDGLVYLPAAGYDSAALHLYDADGNEVSVDRSSTESILVSLAGSHSNPEPQLVGVFELAVQTYLRSEGANPATGEFPSKADPKAIWEDCLAAGTEAWRAKAHELGLD